jgi:hypothetical protein
MSASDTVGSGHSLSWYSTSETCNAETTVRLPVRMRRVHKSKNREVTHEFVVNCESVVMFRKERGIPVAVGMRITCAVMFV